MIDKYQEVLELMEGDISLSNFKLLANAIETDPTLLFTSNYRKFFETLETLFKNQFVLTILGVTQPTYYRERKTLSSTRLLYKKIVRFQNVLATVFNV